MTKTLTFGLVHMTIAFTVAYLMTGSLVIGGALALVEPVINTVAYFLHEKTWDRIRASRRPSEATETLPRLMPGP